MGALILILLIGGLFAVLIVPRQRELRRHQALVASVHEGDQIMTGSGLYGRIVELDDDFVQLEIAPDVVIKLARRAVMAKVDPETEAEAEGDPAGAGPTIELTDASRAPDADVDTPHESDLEIDADDPARPSER